jgi:multicomponent Na+:H+ antiporter subunit G
MSGVLLDGAGVILLGLGLALATIGIVGLLRKDDIFHQLHAAGLVTGPTVLLILLASLATGSAEIVTSAVLVFLFVLVTAPLSGHAIAQAARRRSTGTTDVPPRKPPRG